ncbi:MAG: beta-propeller fold lactonase family protein [Acidobacteriaceae bacterium]
MKFSKFGRIALALAASLVIGFGTQSCNYDYTEAYIIVTGSQYNQIASYKEDNETGYLRPSPHDPLSSGGSNPIRALLLNGGRYVYVLNEGAPTYNSDGSITWSGGNISVFSIGGGGSLSYQLSYPSQGLGSIRMALSTSGTYLYVLDQYQPSTTPNTTPGSTATSTATPCYDSAHGVYRPAGDITVFSIDPSTGRLFLVQNQQQQNALGTPLSYFPVGCAPIDFHLVSSYLYTAEASDPASGNTQVIYAYNAGTTGQLIQVPGGAQPITGATNIGYIGASANGTWIYILDNGTNQIFTFTQGSNGLLSAISGGAYPNFSGAAGMSAVITDSASKYLYVTNTQSPGLYQSGSVITAFDITASTGDLTTLAPGYFGTGATPVCIFEDPSHQYLYTADAGSSTVTGALIDPNTGILTDLRKGSSFTTVGTPTWCLYSSNTD